MQEINNAVWAAIAVLLLLIIGQSAPKFGGWLLIVTVMGMVWQANKRGYLN